jgi:hypothetical protein
MISSFGLGTAGPLRSSDRIGGIFFFSGVVACYQIAYARTRAGRKADRSAPEEQRPPSRRAVIAALLLTIGAMTTFQSVVAYGRTTSHPDAALVGAFVGLLLIAVGLWLVRSLHWRRAHAAG